MRPIDRTAHRAIGLLSRRRRSIQQQIEIETVQRQAFLPIACIHSLRVETNDDISALSCESLTYVTLSSVGSLSCVTCLVGESFTLGKRNEAENTIYW